MNQLDRFVRRATFNDITRLTEMNIQLIEDEQSPNTMTEKQLHHRMWSFLEGRYEGWILMIDNEAAGYCLTLDQTTDIYIRHFFIKRHVRRAGHGRWFIQWLNDNLFVNYQKISVDVLSHNPKAIAFWRAVGFIDHHIHMEKKN